MNPVGTRYCVNAEDDLGIKPERKGPGSGALPLVDYR